MTGVEGIVTTTAKTKPTLPPNQKLEAQPYPPPTATAPESGNKTRVKIYHCACALRLPILVTAEIAASHDHSAYPRQ